MSEFDRMDAATASRIGLIAAGIEPETKAAFGIGVNMLTYGTTEGTFTARTPQAFMRTAQRLSHTNPWIATAERAINQRVSTVPFHLEDDADDEIDDTAGGADGVLLRLIRNPSPFMTRRALWRITSRHMGVSGSAFWFLDQMEQQYKTPLQVLYINPARMTPAGDDVHTVGWLLDYQGRPGTGVPLSPEEVLHFQLEPPDEGHFGIGNVESVLELAELYRVTSRHAINTLGAGGRRGGIVAPKEGTLLPDVYEAAIQSFRNIAERDDSAKRNIILRGAVDYTPTAQTFNELDVTKLMGVTRDDILAVWNVPQAILGIPTSQGLGGESRKYDEAVLWQGPVHDRLTILQETIQYGIIDRFAAATGARRTLEIEEPSFDDQAPAYELLVKAVNAPLSNDQRLALVGLPPLNDAALGAQILIPQNLVALTIDQQRPEPVAPPVQDDMADVEVDMPMGKASAPLAKTRAAVERSITPDIRATLIDFLDRQKMDIQRRVVERADHIVRKPAEASAWWSTKWDRELDKALRPHVLAVVQVVVPAVARLVPIAGKADPIDWEDAVTQFVTGRTGDRITRINDTTRTTVLSTVKDIVQAAADEGLSIPQIGERLSEGIGNLTDWSPSRAEMIARTETMFAYNDAALRSYESVGVERVLAYDGDEDEQCAARNGKDYSLEESYSITDHPNGTLDWAPYFAPR